MLWMRLAAMAALTAIVAGCSGAGADATSTAAPSPSARLPASCPVTIPTGTFVPPMQWPPEPPALYHAAWFGTNELWAMLSRDGEVWPVGQKTFWWSVNYRDPQRESRPAITVEGRRLDGARETFTEGDPATNATADFGLSMLVGVNFPGPGCWEIQATYKGTGLAYVVWIPAG